MRRLALTAIAPALIACDDMPTSQTVDIDAQDATTITAPIVHRAATVEVPPVIEAPRRRSPEPTPTVFQLSPEAAKAEALVLLNPMLSLVPGLADSVAQGQLAPSDALELPDGVAELTSAPWLVLEGRVILADTLDESWLTGAAKMLRAPKTKEEESLFVASRSVAEAELPSALRALVGATISVYDEDHEVCVARVTGFEAEARMEDVGQFGEDGTQELAKHVASDVFDSGTSALLGRLEPVSGTLADCAGGVWAKPVQDKRPMLFRAQKMDKNLSKMGVRAFRKLGTYKQAQDDFASFYNEERPETGRWDATVEHDFRRLLSDDGTRELLVVHADTWDGCGSNGQTLTAVFEVVRKDNKTSLLPVTSRAWSGIPDGIVDLDADGTLEMIQGMGISRWNDKAQRPGAENGWNDETYEQLESFEIPTLGDSGCGC